jgi:hypothetical protein
VEYLIDFIHLLLFQLDPRTRTFLLRQMPAKFSVALNDLRNTIRRNDPIANLNLTLGIMIVMDTTVLGFIAGCCPRSRNSKAFMYLGGAREARSDRWQG